MTESTTPIKKLSNKYVIEKDKMQYTFNIIMEDNNIIFKCKNEKPLKVFEKKLSKNDLEEICNIFKGCTNLNEVYTLLLDLLENKQYEFTVTEEYIGIKFNKINIFEFKNIFLTKKEIDISEKVENLYQIQEDLMKEINSLKIENENLKKEIELKNQNEKLKNLGEEYELINVNLINGASNYGGSYSPFQVYKLKNNFVKLSGLINCSGSSIVCQLPENCRPNEILIFNCSFNGSSIRVDIYKNGNVYVYGSGSGSGYLSLDNILFLSVN